MTNEEMVEQAVAIYEYSDGSDVQCRKDLQGARVVYACYETGSYEGGWCVIYVKDGQWYVDEGSHCSCNEPSWSPTATTPEYLLSKDFGPYLCDEARIKAAVQAALKT